MNKKCPTCLTSQNCQHSEPVINHPIPNQAWTKVAADPFHLYGNCYLLMIDHYYYSKFIVIEMVKNVQSLTVVNECKHIFCTIWDSKRVNYQ